MLGRLALYARTLRHLRPVQWVYLPLRRVQPARFRVPRDLPAPSAARAGALAGAVRGWLPADPSTAVATADAVLAGRFRFLNVERHLPRVDWSARHESPLWTYALQYHDFARDLAAAWAATGEAAYARGFERLATEWIDGTRPGSSPAWDPYPVSLRAVNWIVALSAFGDGMDAGFRERASGSLAAQLAWLERRLELHILANHLQKNYLALLAGGLFFDGDAAERWRRVGARGLWRELDEQVLPDGGHYERSPMYHAIALRDYLEAMSLCDAAGEPVPAAARARVVEMVRAFGALSRPDGTLHLFNDAAQGASPPRAELDRLARAVVGTGVPSPAGTFALPETGYFGFAGEGERLLVDCGVPGPTYQAGHAHCDLLSFELDLDGRPVVVDSGLSGYDGDPLRAYQRSTRAHSTVMVDGREQSEPWATFRMARRATPLGAGWEEGDAPRFRGAYRPFHSRTARHERSLERDAGGWTVTDRVTGAPGVPLTSFLHLHPDFEVRVEGMVAVAVSPGLTVRVETFGADALAVRRGETGSRPQGWYLPEFGRALAAPVLEMRVEQNDGRPFGYRIRREAGA